MAERLQRNPDFKKYAKEKEIAFKEDFVTLNYDNFSLQEVLRQMLPDDVEVPGGFEAVGQIAHLNLHENQMPFKYQIGQAIVDKNPAISTVVTKIGHIESTFRFYDLECIAGEPKFEADVTEDKVRFKVDVSKMYWCSKLSTERNRLISDFFKDHQVICDMFCGVGPLAVKAAVKKPLVKVLANDLNP
jgi:tRNA (guanine37-N1)-methyltransferase